MVRVGVIGLGFMGATHVAAYQSATRAGSECKLVAVCDPKASRREGHLGDVGGNAVSNVASSEKAFDPSIVRGYERAEELIADRDIDLVSICTRTDTHVELAIKAMRAGKHALIEKPVALTAPEIEKIAAVQRETKRICMPAMCIRFWPGWSWIKERVIDGTLGKCVSATFQRLASPPNWSRSFFLDGAKSGGALVDLHIHDADFVRYCFGDPPRVTSGGRKGPSGAVDHVTTIYHYGAGGPEHVTAEGGFDQASGFAFRMRYVAIFEKATADYDLTRTPSMLLCRDGKSEAVELPAVSGYDVQTRKLIESIARGDTAGLPTLQEAVAVTRLLDAERESVTTGRTVSL